MNETTTCRVKRAHIERARKLVPNGDRLSMQAVLDVVVEAGLEALQKPAEEAVGAGAFVSRQKESAP